MFCWTGIVGLLYKNLKNLNTVFIIIFKYMNNYIPDYNEKKKFKDEIIQKMKNELPHNHFNQCGKIENFLCFIHIPKTSGTSFESKQIIKCWHRFNAPNIYRLPPCKGGFPFCDGSGEEHWPLYDNIFKMYENHYKISIVRNPFDLLCSYYFHFHENSDIPDCFRSGWGGVNNIYNFSSFKEFIVSYCNLDFEWHVPALKNFLFSQLFDKDGQCVADIILKFEYIDTAKKILGEVLNSPFDEIYENKSSNKKKNYKDYYDDEMIKLVEKKCSRELKFFNYNFYGSTEYEPIIINYKKINYNLYTDKIEEIG